MNKAFLFLHDLICDCKFQIGLILMPLFFFARATIYTVDILEIKAAVFQSYKNSHSVLLAQWGMLFCISIFRALRSSGCVDAELMVALEQIRTRWAMASYSSSFIRSKRGLTHHTGWECASRSLAPCKCFEWTKQCITQIWIKPVCLALNEVMRIMARNVVICHVLGI